MLLNTFMCFFGFCFFVVVIFHHKICFFDQVWNFRNRTLANQKREMVVSNCQWNCMSKWTVGECLIASYHETDWKRRLIFLKARINFSQCLVWKFNHFKKNCFKGAFWWCMLHSRYCSDCQMTLRTNCFVDRTFRGSNWSPTKQSVKGC